LKLFQHLDVHFDHHLHGEYEVRGIGRLDIGNKDIDMELGVIKWEGATWFRRRFGGKEQTFSAQF
jgi:hypothetical protein